MCGWWWWGAASVRSRRSLVLVSALVLVSLVQHRPFVLVQGCHCDIVKDKPSAAGAKDRSVRSDSGRGLVIVPVLVCLQRHPDLVRPLIKHHPHLPHSKGDNSRGRGDFLQLELSKVSEHV